MDAAIPISELIVELIAAIGVGPFILVVFVLLIVGLAPGIINRIFDAVSKKRSGDEIKNSIEGIQVQVGAIVTIEELVKDRILKLNEHVKSIQERMRNVMSEEDIIRFASVKLGVEEDFKTRLLKSIFKILDKVNGDLESDLKLRINSQWQDLKNDLYSLNAPIDLKEFIDSFDSKFDEDSSLFLGIKNAMDNEKLNIERKRDRIEMVLDSTLMDIRNNLSSRLKR